jgi:hypothetical protein
MALTYFGIGERRKVAPQGIEEVEAVEDADALVSLAQGVDVGITGDEMRGSSGDGAGYNDIIIGIGWDTGE